MLDVAQQVQRQVDVPSVGFDAGDEYAEVEADRAVSSPAPLAGQLQIEPPEWQLPLQRRRYVVRLGLFAQVTQGVQCLWAALAYPADQGGQAFPAFAISC